MRLQQFITESEDISIDEITKLIKRDCKKFLISSKNNPVFRGINSNKIFDIKTPRKDRRPKDTEQKYHEMFDKTFMKYHGIRARSEGVFVTGDLSEASLYGNPYTVFPIGNFKFLWNPNIFDLTMAVSPKMVYKTSNIFWKFMIKTGIVTTEMTQDQINSIVKEYMSTNLVKAIRSGNEIMIFCKKYYIVNWNTYLNMKL